MAWTALTFVDCSILTAAKMTALQDNFAALAQQDGGAPVVRFPNSGPYGNVPASFGTIHAGSGFAAPQVSSFGSIHVSSGLRVSDVASIKALNVEDGFARVDASSGFNTAAPGSLGSVEVASNASFFGGLRFPHFALRYIPGNPPTVLRQFNVDCLERLGSGLYSTHLGQAFVNSDYFLMGIGINRPGVGVAHALIDPASSTLTRVVITNYNGASNVDSPIGALTVLGFGD